jgi:hypothetical protein
MAEQFQHPHSPVPSAPLLQRITLEAHRHLSRFTTLAFVGGSAVLGVESFNTMIALWPLYPSAVPLLLIGCAVVFSVDGLIRGTPRDPALSYRPPRGGRVGRRLR